MLRSLPPVWDTSGCRVSSSEFRWSLLRAVAVLVSLPELSLTSVSATPRRLPRLQVKLQGRDQGSDAAG